MKHEMVTGLSSAKGCQRYLNWLSRAGGKRKNNENVLMLFSPKGKFMKP